MNGARTSWPDAPRLALGIASSPEQNAGGNARNQSEDRLQKRTCKKVNSPTARDMTDTFL